jgi:hypothetical protein
MGESKIMSNQFKSQAWLLWGLTGSLPGTLAYADGNLTYTAHTFGTLFERQLAKLEELVNRPGLSHRLNNAKTSLVFSKLIGQIHISFPWYYFSGGMKVEFDQKKFRFSFAQPNTLVIRKAKTGGIESRRVGKSWQKVLKSGLGAFELE